MKFIQILSAASNGSKRRFFAPLPCVCRSFANDKAGTGLDGRHAHQERRRNFMGAPSPLMGTYIFEGLAVGPGSRPASLWNWYKFDQPRATAQNDAKF